jgi:hypothetical protein
MVAWLSEVKSGARLALTMVGAIVTISALVTDCCSLALLVKEVWAPESVWLSL